MRITVGGMSGDIEVDLGTAETFFTFWLQGDLQVIAPFWRGSALSDADNGHFLRRPVGVGYRIHHSVTSALRTIFRVDGGI